MSIKTLRKRIAITATSALVAGALSVVAAPASFAHSAVGVTNTETSVGQIAGSAQTNNTTTTGSMYVATATNTGAAAVASVTSVTGLCSEADDSGRSKGLLYKDSSSGIAQSATVLQGATLSFYACTSTAAAFIASAGTFSSPSGGAADNTGWTYNSSNTKVWSPLITTATTGTAVGVLWTAPTTVGTYTVSLYTGFATNASGDNVIQSATTGVTPETLSGNITVSVVTAGAGGSYNAGESFCKAVKGTTTTPADNIDDTGTNADGVDWSIDFALNDAYGADLDSGNLSATATNGALLAFGTAGATPVAGTASTITVTGDGANRTVRVSQKTAGEAMTTTVTIAYNGTTVCTKTVSIAGTVAKLTISNVAVQDLGASAGNALWFAGETRAGTFYVVATDTVGTRIATPATLGTYSADGATLGTTVTTVTFDSSSLATKTSSTDVLSATVGRHTCAATAGTQKGVVIKFTLANGTVIKSAPTDLSCADDPASMTASFDKAKYISGEVATLTISFKDSKGNVANNVVAPGTAGTAVVSVPGMTLVSTTGASDAVLKSGGKFTYTYTVGQTAGSFAAVVDFTTTNTTTGQYSTIQTPSYSISTGGDTTTNADVLKSIVALIASINKQIQALQKLILKR
jgi:hypothetical protein